MTNARFAALSMLAAVTIVTTATLVSTALTQSNQVDVMYWADPENGCQYLLTDAGVLTPRNHSDGMQMCAEDEDGWPMDQADVLPDADYPPAPELPFPESTAIGLTPVSGRVAL